MSLVDRLWDQRSAAFSSASGDWGTSRRGDSFCPSADPFFSSSRSVSVWDEPFSCSRSPAALSRHVDDEFRRLENRLYGSHSQDLYGQRFRDVGIREGSNAVLDCNVIGYSPKEIQVRLDGGQLLIEGEHREQGDGHSLHRRFSRSIALPEGVGRRSLHCNVDDKTGQLTVQAASPQPQKPAETRQIPITFVTSSESPPAERRREPEEVAAGDGAVKEGEKSA